MSQLFSGKDKHIEKQPFAADAKYRVPTMYIPPPVSLPLGRVWEGLYFKIILIRAVTSLTLISPSPLMSHTASE